MAFIKKTLIPDYLYSARVNECDIQYFESLFYNDIEFYPDEIKQSNEKFEYAKRMGYVYLDWLKLRIMKLPPIYSIKELGNYGFKWKFIPEILENDSSKKYTICAGAGTDISFEIEFSRNYPNEKIILMDPSPQAIQHVESLVLPENMQFLKNGLSDKDDVLMFYKPSTPGLGSLSAIGLHPSNEVYELPVISLSTLLSNLVLDKSEINYLKFDIEGSEHVVIEHLISNNIRPSQIAFEFDQPVPPWTIEKTMKKLLAYDFMLVDVWGLNVLLVDKTQLQD